jgi:CRP-like cAMP-binding protein
LSKNKLGTGATGYGYLLVALGVGGILASLFVNRLAALRRLSAVLALGMIAYAAPTAILVVVHSPSIAFVIEIVRGAATLLVDVLAMTALQRSLPPDLISRVFGVFWALVIAGLAVGAFVTPFLLRGAGLDGSLFVAAFAVPALVLLVYPRLASIDRLAGDRTAVFAPRMRVLEALEIFAAAPRTVLERLAAAATESTVDAGTIIVAEGDDADALYVLASGEVEVLAAGEIGTEPQHIRFMQAPSYFGEIGLIEQIPRTATVRAVGECGLWRIDGDTFLAALSESTPSQLLVQGMAGRLARTHPSRTTTLAAASVAEPVTPGAD